MLALLAYWATGPCRLKVTAERSFCQGSSVRCIYIDSRKFCRNWISVPDEPAVALSVNEGHLSVDFVSVPEFPEGEYDG